MIPYGKQNITEQDISAVVDVLRSDWLTQGPKVPEFETVIANYCSAQYACATNSATSALHLACLALNVGKDDVVWTSPISFVASANCALYCGAQVDFVDIDIETGNMSVEKLATKLAQAKQSNTLPKVIIPVHLAGQSCDMKAIFALAQQYQIKIIEDASHAIGAKYQDKPVGCCQYSDITVFSFHPVKIITSAEGGMATCNDAQLAKRMKRLRSHGITNDPSEMTEPSHGPWYYQQVELGFNYRMTELQAALGISQFTRLEQFITKRNKLAQSYISALMHLPLEHLKQSSDCYSSYHLFIVRLLPDDKHLHAKLIATLRQQGITSHLHYIPIHLQPYYQKLGFQVGDFPNAEKYYQQAMTIPLYPDLTRSEQQTVIENIKSALCD
ncbi:UDP-4-amino-4,6-dideoxy-N-acetyl-beta-L-altrosamine transaminase [Pseudoalteromonas sp. JBTF-M23]|uniref:UDP-4-amino-4, 6-dideoxy-N-acetyl-beta-L-altrosamine transaminase n=1 Tax=Pseudoalteromonas caenipelagi TaxID=2726988 RepID=A0A849VBQ0_9GAMM|nr:UDP-4-amino-4,6-dideoxy-N-acetyl-beta-L-altrosamine transaminase [Pseudoalteromonas caenipelagi]NOU50792.1 UDP-4-amino-4,6-dideoxy-N-acetyl-beta-L-altrosamine transaminase [Pseudoalteromonas caenipelagi]